MRVITLTRSNDEELKGWMTTDDYFIGKENK